MKKKYILLAVISLIISSCNSNRHTEYAVYPELKELTVKPGASSLIPVKIEIPDKQHMYANPKGPGTGKATEIIIPINIDETPVNILIPESEDLSKAQNPIYTPDSTITSYEILIEDIDIPVEVKANRPILVDVNDQQTWTQIRSL